MIRHVMSALVCFLARSAFILHPSRAVTVRVILTLQHGGGHVTGVVGVDLKSLAPASSVRARRDRESPQALRYGGGSVTRIVAPMVVVGPGPY